MIIRAEKIIILICRTDDDQLFGAYDRIVLATRFSEARRKLCTGKCGQFLQLFCGEFDETTYAKVVYPMYVIEFYIRFYKNGKFWMAVDGVPVLSKFVHTRVPSTVRANSLLNSGARRWGCVSRLWRIAEDSNLYCEYVNDVAGSFRTNYMFIFLFLRKNADLLKLLVYFLFFQRNTSIKKWIKFDFYDKNVKFFAKMDVPSTENIYRISSEYSLYTVREIAMKFVFKKSLTNRK